MTDEEEWLKTRIESGTLVVLTAIIVLWATLGPGGWVSGVIGALVGLAVAGALVVFRRRASSRD